MVVDKWKEHLEYSQNSNEDKELSGTDGEQFELEWNIFPGHIQIKMATRRTRPGEFEDRIIFMSMFNDIDWRRMGCPVNVFSDSLRVRDYEKRISDGTWVFSRSWR